MNAGEGWRRTKAGQDEGLNEDVASPSGKLAGTDVQLSK